MKTKTKEASFPKNENHSLPDPEAVSIKKSVYSDYLLYAFAGFCFSQLDSLGDMSPFAVSFLSGIKFDYCFSTFIASSLGYLISKDWQSALRHITASFLICIVRLILNRRFPHKDLGRINHIACFFITALTSTIFTAFTGFSYIRFFMAICEGVLSLCACVIFIRSFRTPVLKTGISALGIKDSVCIVVSVCIFLMCMSGFDIEGLSPARILSCLILMFISFHNGIAVSSISGICIGGALCIDEAFRYLFPCYAVSSLVAGVFSASGQIMTAVSFGACYSLISLSEGSGSNVIISLSEVAVASCAFMLIPTERLTFLGDLLKKRGIAPDDTVSRQVSDNLHQAADRIYEVSGIIEKISDKLDSIINPEVNRLFADLQQSVCVGCENKSICWNKMFDSTASDILSISGIEKRARGKLPLEKRCTRESQLRSRIEENYFEYANNMAVKMKVREMRKVLTDQFCFMGDFLWDTADKISGSKIKDSAKSSALKTAMQDSGVYADSVSYYADRDGRVTIEISIIDRPFETDRSRLREIIETVSKRSFSEPDITVGDVKTTITFEERYLYELQSGYCQKPLSAKGFCGDSVCFVASQDGVKTAILSDGMGTGSRAAIDSSLTSSVIEKLICAGFSVSSAIKTVNSAMIMKSTDESISTADTVSVNLYTGAADFYKSGAAISFIRRGNEIFIIRQESLPLGIIRNICPAHSTVELSPGDIILLVSDGVTSEDCGWINDELLSWSTNNMQDLASHICSLAVLRSDKHSRDDITAVALKISRSRQEQDINTITT